MTPALHCTMHNYGPFLKQRRPWQFCSFRRNNHFHFSINIFQNSFFRELFALVLCIVQRVSNILKYTGCLKKNFLLSKLARANFTVDNEKSIEKGDNGTVVAYPALRQTCNPPGFGFCSLFGRLVW